ncbi:MAG: PAS domain S-box protein, partial [Planctomycetota bacterium]|nr:PAS domain S-box protein [Planctomycetota bacterium]
MEGQDLNASEALVRAMVDSALDAVVGMDHEGRIIEFSRAAERMFGLSRVDAVGEPLGELLVPPSLRERHRHALARYLESGEARILGQRLELTALRADGREFPIELTVARLDLEGPPRFVGFIRDIAPLRRLEEERRDLDRSIQRAQRLESLGVLAGGIAHDFNNILVGVLGNAGLALDALPSSAPVRVFLERIKRAGQRAEQLADQLLAYSGKGLFVVVPLDLNDEIEQISDLLRSSISKKAILKLDLRADLPAIEGDGAQIGQVVMNLITNASEAIGDESGVISVRTDVLDVDRADLRGFDFHRDDPKGRLVSLVVSDTGCGMDAETRDKIFEPFFTTKFTGRGLGLAATLGIVRGHAGAMRVTSSPGEGTTFEIVFPESTRRVEVARPLEPD